MQFTVLIFLTIQVWYKTISNLHSVQVWNTPNTTFYIWNITNTVYNVLYCRRTTQRLCTTQSLYIVCRTTFLRNWPFTTVMTTFHVSLVNYTYPMHRLPQKMSMHSFELKSVHSCYPTIVRAVSKLFPLVCLSGGSLVLSLQRNSLCRPSSCHFLMGCPALFLLTGLLDYIFTKKMPK